VAQIIAEVSRTFNEYLLLPNRTRTDCSPVPLGGVGLGGAA
jgi:IMP dehydrogenase